MAKMELRQATDAEIRRMWKHGLGNRHVRIGKDGTVRYYGSHVSTDRSQDFWHDVGTRANYVTNVDNGRTYAK